MDLIFVYKIGSKCRYFISNAAHMKSNIYIWKDLNRSATNPISNGPFQSHYKWYDYFVFCHTGYIFKEIFLFISTKDQGFNLKRSFEISNVCSMHFESGMKDAC